MNNITQIRAVESEDGEPIVQRWESYPVDKAGWRDWAAFTDVEHAKQNLANLRKEAPEARYRLKPKTED